jgi:hypothetical protein
VSTKKVVRVDMATVNDRHRRQERVVVESRRSDAPAERVRIEVGPTWKPSKGGHVGPSSTARGRRGSKHHLIADPGGILLSPLVDAVPPIRGRRGQPRRRPRELFPDRGFDADTFRR